MKNFIKESNKIEGITTYGEEEQMDAYYDFLNLNQLTINDILELATTLHHTSCDRSGRTPFLRDKPGMDVRVGSHTPPLGGWLVTSKLKKLLDKVNTQTDHKQIYHLHAEYESIHPLTDCNGRTGRAIWLWLMSQYGYNFELGFLHSWYYQSLDNWR